jgi:hypothetical protein
MQINKLIQSFVRADYGIYQTNPALVLANYGM